MPGSMQNSGLDAGSSVVKNDQLAAFGKKTFWLKSVAGQTHAFDGVAGAVMPNNNTVACMQSTISKYGIGALDSTKASPKTIVDNKYALMNRDFTCEFWVYLLNWGNYSGDICGGTGWRFNTGNSHWTGGAWFNWNNYWDIWGNSPGVTSYSGVIPRNSWHHWSVTRKGADLYMHLDGVFQSNNVIGTSQNINTGWNGGTDLTVDQFWIGNGSGINFYVEDIMLYVGKACRTKSNFTPVAVTDNTPSPLIY